MKNCHMKVRRAITTMAMQMGIDPLSAMRFVHPDTSAGQIAALQAAWQEVRAARESGRGERCASLS